MLSYSFILLCFSLFLLFSLFFELVRLWPAYQMTLFHPTHDNSAMQLANMVGCLKRSKVNRKTAKYNNCGRLFIMKGEQEVLCLNIYITTCWSEDKCSASAYCWWYTVFCNPSDSVTCSSATSSPSDNITKSTLCSKISAICLVDVHWTISFNIIFTMLFLLQHSPPESKRPLSFTTVQRMSQDGVNECHRAASQQNVHGLGLIVN